MAARPPFSASRCQRCLKVKPAIHSSAQLSSARLDLPRHRQQQNSFTAGDTKQMNQDLSHSTSWQLQTGTAAVFLRVTHSIQKRCYNSRDMALLALAWAICLAWPHCTTDSSRTTFAPEAHTAAEMSHLQHGAPSIWNILLQ
jgi:hypothetical protein